jgi:hypothetical protein
MFSPRWLFHCPAAFMPYIMADMRAAPSVMAASTTWPRPERAVSNRALSTPTASSMAPPPKSPT